MARGKSRRSLESIADANTEEMLQGHADMINTALARSAEAILDAGRRLILAKHELPHGHWERLFQGHPDAVKRPVPFGVRTAQRLMAVAEHPVLSKTTHASLLPPRWDTLYQLTAVPDITLERAIAAGAIHPGMTRREVAVLREMPEEKPPRPDAELVAPMNQELRLRATIYLLEEALDEVDKAVEAKTIDPAEAIRYYTGIAEMATEAAGLAVKIQVNAQRQAGRLLAEVER